MALRVRSQTFPIGVPSLLDSSDSPFEPSGSKLSPKANGDRPDRDKPKWSLTPAAFDKLLGRFSTNRDEAGVQYELARRKLVRFFEWRSVGRAEEYADETLNRVARRLEEGQNIDNLMAYIFGVARVVLMEALKERERTPIALDDAPAASLRQDAPVIIDPDVRQTCLDHCLEKLGVESRDLMLGYLEGEGRVKIDNRQAMADELQINLNALRIRVHRVKQRLEICIAECLRALPGETINPSPPLH